jgi:hypothetical protein
MVRHLLGRRSEAGFLAEVAHDWPDLFPVLPHQSEANRRIRWLWGAFEQFRAALAAHLPEDDCQQAGTTALPVKHTSRVRGADSWTGPGGLGARSGRYAAHAEWFYGFRLAAKADLGSRIIRAWASCPPPSTNVTWVPACQKPGRHHATCWWTRASPAKHSPPGRPPEARPVLIPPTKNQRHRMPAILRKIIAEWRNRVETTFKEITDQMELARHGAHTF